MGFTLAKCRKPDRPSVDGDQPMVRQKADRTTKCRVSARAIETSVLDARTSWRADLLFYCDRRGLAIGSACRVRQRAMAAATRSSDIGRPRLIAALRIAVRPPRTRSVIATAPSETAQKTRCDLGGCQPGLAPVSNDLVPAGCTVVQRLGRLMPWRSQTDYG